MKVPELLKPYVNQTDSYETYAALYGKEGGDREYMRMLVDMYFTEKVNYAIDEIQENLENEGVGEDIISEIEYGYYEQRLEALTD